MFFIGFINFYAVLGHHLLGFVDIAAGTHALIVCDHFFAQCDVEIDEISGIAALLTTCIMSSEVSGSVCSNNNVSLRTVAHKCFGSVEGDNLTFINVTKERSR